jgi:hypothetical protein
MKGLGILYGDTSLEKYAILFFIYLFFVEGKKISLNF